MHKKVKTSPHCSKIDGALDQEDLTSGRLGIGLQIGLGSFLNTAAAFTN